MTQYAQNLTEMTDIFVGHQFRGAIKPIPSGETLVIQMSNVAPELPVPWWELASVNLPKGSRPRYLEEGDVVFAARGYRNFAVHCQGIPSDKPVVLSPHFFLIRVRSNALNPGFLAWQLNQRPIQKQLDTIAAGSNQRAIPIKEIKRFQIAVPPIEQQQQIVALNDVLSRERMVLKALIENQQHMMTGIAQDLLATN